MPNEPREVLFEARALILSDTTKSSQMEGSELPTATVRRQVVSSLHTVTDLADALSRHGLSKDDRIDRRDQVLMFRKIEREMKTEIARSARVGKYDDAKDCEARLGALRTEFDWLLTLPEARSRTEQVDSFGSAAAKMYERLEDDNFVTTGTLERTIRELRDDQVKTFQIEHENLELQLSRLNKPPMAYSKRLADLVRAEAGLIRCLQFEDARNVRRMIDKLEPKERRAHDAHWQAYLDRRRRELVEKHAADSQRLDENIKAMQMNAAREMGSSKQVFAQRLKNHAKDMVHAHTVESRRRPEMSIVPSAAQQPRPGYTATGSSKRGQQLLDNVRGKQAGDQVFVSSLVDVHAFSDFDKPPGPSSPRSTVVIKASDLMNTITLPQDARGFRRSNDVHVDGEGGVMLAPTLRPHRRY